METGITNGPGRTPVPLEVRFRPDPEDRVALCMRLWDLAAARHRQAPAYQVGRTARRLLLTVVAVTVAAFVLFLVFLPEKVEDFFIPYVVATALLILLQLVLLAMTGPSGYFRPEAARAHALEQARRYAGAPAAGDWHVVLTPEGVLVTAEGGRREMAWPDVAGVDSTPDHVFFFDRSGQGIAVPRRAFADEATFRQFVETARAWHGRAVAARPPDL